MKNILLLLLLLSANNVCLAQDWVQVGELNNTPRIFFNDTVSGLLYISGNFRFNGNDTIDGFCAFNGDTFTSFGRRYDCVTFGCDPVFLIARYGDHIYLSGPGLTKIDGVAVQGIARMDENAQWEAAMPGLWNADNDPSLDRYYIQNGLFYAVGFFKYAEGDICNSVAYWNGSKWTGLAFLPWSDNSVPRVTEIIFYKDQLYVGGNFSWAGSGGADIARLDSTGWQMVGGGLYGGFANINDMVIYKGDLYICGYFRKQDGNVGNKIMRWNGQEWLSVGDGFCAPNIIPTEMMVYNDKLYVVGLYDCVQNNITANSIANWDGARWCNLGSSYFNNKIACITEYKNEIYIGGGFTEVDGQPLKYFAKWVGDHSTDVCSDPVVSAPAPPGVSAALKLSPNPAGDVLRVETGENAASVQVWDVYGRVMEGFKQEVRGAEVVLDLSQLPAGWYLISAVLQDGTVVSGKFIKL